MTTDKEPQDIEYDAHPVFKTAEEESSKKISVFRDYRSGILFGVSIAERQRLKTGHEPSGE
tara:strand:+ start:128 stop:310 length:183 start_codon:yes stop_codon:yes gene_type:complete